MYKLYGQNKIIGWQLIKTSDDLDKLNLIAGTLRAKDYYEYLIIEHSEKGDSTVRRQELYDECEVEYTDDVKVGFEVKATTFKPSKMKQKEELRKMAEEYTK